MALENKPQEAVKEELGRGLKNRHIQMIAIGGAIGTGLFYGSASVIQVAGPATILSYAFVGLIVYFMMRALGEMAVEEPVSGSYVSYAIRYVHPFFGFLVAWTWIFATAAYAAAEYNAIGQYVQFWAPGVPIWVSGACAMALIIVVNLAAVRIFGEMEFWTAIIKVTAIIAMIVLGAAIVFFGVGGVEPVGISNLTANGGFFPHGAKGILLSLVTVVFSYAAIESVGITAGEAGDPKTMIPKATNSIAWRIVVFYVGAIFIILCMENWQNIGTQGSPFVTVLSQTGIPGAAHIMNVVVITAVISSMNTSIYVCTRLLYTLSLQGMAPKGLQKVNKSKIPFRAVIIMMVVQILGIIANFFLPTTAFAIFSAMTAVGTIICWASIAIAHIPFRLNRMREGTADTISFKMPFFPILNILVLAFLLVVIITFWFVTWSRPSLFAFPPFAVVMYILYKLVFEKTMKKRVEELKAEDERMKK